MECVMFDKRLDQAMRIKAVRTLGLKKKKKKKVPSGNICSIGTAQWHLDNDMFARTINAMRWDNCFAEVWIWSNGEIKPAEFQPR